MKKAISDILWELIPHENQFVITEKDVLDYITNLQQENNNLKTSLDESQEVVIDLQQKNERLKLELSGYREAILRDDKLLGLQKRIEKAVEYIMSELVDEWSIKNDGCVDGSDLPVSAITPILDILNGRSDE